MGRKRITICPRCGIRPKAKGQGYCRECRAAGAGEPVASPQGHLAAHEAAAGGVEDPKGIVVTGTPAALGRLDEKVREVNRPGSSRAEQPPRKRQVGGSNPSRGSTPSRRAIIHRDAIRTKLPGAAVTAREVQERLAEVVRKAGEPVEVKELAGEAVPVVEVCSKHKLVQPCRRCQG